MRMREITEEDAQAYLAFNRALVKESDYLLLEPGEQTMNIEEQKRRINKMLSMDRATIIVAEQADHIIGQGTKKHSLVVNGAYVDEYVMAKLV
ncbi:hypothetical protein [Caldalkalibacillus salinus]|uniref:hypothetical protein n=1 Tax=Caldalkalibacillus salinus TaxID=2803787 RepID=UPI0019239C40|nr:hypothetical protein [Caldalkalibacillus salinus]